MQFSYFHMPFFFLLRLKKGKKATINPIKAAAATASYVIIIILVGESTLSTTASLTQNLFRGHQFFKISYFQLHCINNALIKQSIF